MVFKHSKRNAKSTYLTGLFFVVDHICIVYRVVKEVHKGHTKWNETLQYNKKNTCLTLARICWTIGYTLTVKRTRVWHTAVYQCRAVDIKSKRTWSSCDDPLGKWKHKKATMQWFQKHDSCCIVLKYISSLFLREYGQSTEPCLLINT